MGYKGWGDHRVIISPGLIQCLPSCFKVKMNLRTEYKLSTLQETAIN